VKEILAALRRKLQPIIVIAAQPDWEPAVLCECLNCLKQFWVDPCGEENLVEKGGVLKEKCPRCGVENA
jgi:hypothetical protein